MIKAIENVLELEKICRQQLVIQSELPNEMVRNALSTYGETLDKVLFKTTHDGICLCDALLLFELQTNNSTTDISMIEEDDTISIYKSYTVHVIIYGNASATIAGKLIARLRSEAVRTYTYEQGVYIETVSDDTSANEYKNEVMWRRHDFNFNITCRISVNQITPDSAFDIVKIDKIIT